MRYLFILTISAINLTLEHLWNNFWRSFILIAFFISLALFQVPQAIGVNLFLSIFVVLLSFSFFGRKNLSIRPSLRQVQSAIEKNSNLKNNPIESSKDKPIKNLSEDSLTLWEKHLKNTTIYIKKLKIYKPCFDITSQDIFALRYLAVILLVVSFIVAGDDWRIKIDNSFSPQLGNMFVAENTSINLWIEPPKYTGEPAVFLPIKKEASSGMVKNNIRVPMGSLLKLRMDGYKYAPSFKYAKKKYKFGDYSDNSFVMDFKLLKKGDLELSYFLKNIGKWHINVYKDSAPVINIVKVEKTARDAIKIIYNIKDDHGIDSIMAYIVPPKSLIKTMGDIRYSFDIPVEGVEGKQNYIEDLTSHIWAGMPVEIYLEAIDSAGNKTLSKALNMVLPKRKFRDYTAKEIIKQRKNIIKFNGGYPQLAIRKLANIASQLDLYDGNVNIFMGLNSAVKRMVYNKNNNKNNNKDKLQAALESASQLLWNLALKLEDGGLSFAQKEFSNSLQKLSRAINNKTIGDKELQSLVLDVQKKMNSYLRRMALELRRKIKHGDNMPVLSPSLAAKFAKSINIKKMLEDMQRMSQSASRKNLKDMVSGLKNLVNNFDINKFNKIQKREMQAMKSLQEIENIIKTQEKLLDKTNRLNLAKDIKKESLEQRRIKNRFNNLIENMAKSFKNIPKNFASANGYMIKSIKYLNKSLAKKSIFYQKNILKELNKGLDEAVLQMTKKMKQSIMSFGFMPGGGNFGDKYDPLGRNIDNNDDSIKILNGKQNRRVQKIIEELRRRSNSLNKSKIESDYLERLLN